MRHQSCEFTICSSFLCIRMFWQTSGFQVGHCGLLRPLGGGVRVGTAALGGWPVLEAEGTGPVLRGCGYCQSLPVPSPGSAWVRGVWGPPSLFSEGKALQNPGRRQHGRWGGMERGEDSDHSDAAGNWPRKGCLRHGNKGMNLFWAKTWNLQTVISVPSMWQETGKPCGRESREAFHSLGSRPSF